MLFLTLFSFGLSMAGVHRLIMVGYNFRYTKIYWSIKVKGINASPN